MSCLNPEMHELLGSFVLGACESQEREDFEHHLNLCESCRQEVASYGNVLEGLFAAELPDVEDIGPSEVLKLNIMEAVREDAEKVSVQEPEQELETPNQTATVEPAAEPGLPVDVPDSTPATSDQGTGSSFGETAKKLFGSGRRAFASRPIFAGAAAALVAVLLGVAILGSSLGSSTRVAKVDKTLAPNGIAQVKSSGDNHTLVVKGLPNAGEGREYEVWLSKGDQAPAPTNALFKVDANGQATVTLPSQTGSFDKVLVTSEPEGGSQVPTSKPLLVAELG